MSKKTCMNCSSSNLEVFLDLGSQPNGNAFPDTEELALEETFPFVMVVCNDCWQVQLKEFPSTESMFTNHPYVTGLNQPVVSHMGELASNIVDKVDLATNSLVVDIGANDGTLLSKFRDLGMRVIGIDPCQRTQKLAENEGITVFKSFWNKESAEAFRQLGICPDVITATAVFYHVNDLHSFVEGLDLVMGDETIFVTQCVYLKDIIEKNQFDHFYHEHTLIHALGPLKKLLSAHGLLMLDVEFYPVHGGSFVLYVGREGARLTPTEKVDRAIEGEQKAGLYDMQTYLNFAQQVHDKKDQLNTILSEAKAAGKTVFGLGAPAKGSSLLNFFEIGPDLVECITEVNPHKIGRYSPGTHIPIVDESDIKSAPDYYLILSWNFLDFFREKYADFLAAGGKFIVPHPTISIIEE